MDDDWMIVWLMFYKPLYDQNYSLCVSFHPEIAFYRCAYCTSCRTSFPCQTIVAFASVGYTPAKKMGLFRWSCWSPLHILNFIIISSIVPLIWNFTQIWVLSIGFVQHCVVKYAPELLSAQPTNQLRKKWIILFFTAFRSIWSLFKTHLSKTMCNPAQEARWKVQQRCLLRFVFNWIFKFSD